MTKKSAKGEFNSFVKGLVTEASPLNFPEQAARDLNNFELNKDGTLYRRRGFGFEADYEYIDTLLSASDVEDGFLSSYVWEDPAGIAGEKYLVIQTGASLKFYDLNTESVSQFGFLGQISFPSTNLVLNSSSYASVDGKLVIATGDANVYLVQYSPVTENFSLSTFTLKTRDLWGISYVNSDNDPTYRPTSDVPLHRYNLYNQGWNIPRRVNVSTFADPSATVSSLGFWPADCDTVWAGIVTIPNGVDPLETFTNSAFRETLNATFSSSKGSFIIDLLNRGASREAAIVSNKASHPVMLLSTISTVDDITTRGACVVSEYAGRIFYAGFGPTINGDSRSPDLSSYVAFSRLIRNVNDFSKCYQEGDPASRDSSEVVDTDGGLIRISGATGINKLVVAGKNLLVFASNGVWAIEGGSDFGFTASNYKVDKISSFGAIGPDSTVTDGSKVYYWSTDSIYVVMRNELGDLIYQSVSEAAIESFYEEITSVNKSKARGLYDKITKKIRWIYPEGAIFSSSSITKELVFDLVLGSWSVNSVYNLPNTNVDNLFSSSPFITTSIFNEVLVGTDEVFSGVEQVSIDEVQITSELQSIKYIALIETGGSIKLTIGWYKNESFLDWFDVNSAGNDAFAYILTGAMTAGDSSIHKQTPVLIMHMRRTELTIDSNFILNNRSGCLVRTMWDWANSANSKKWSPLFQAYRYRRHYMPETAPGDYDNGFELITTRNKLRGRGRAISIYIESEPTKDCKIVGWNLSLNGNSIA
jgi:hypothetical protein